ncbi:1,6-anhydro-N-acetylmuramyl-L-alanine amidase AmpD [Utexia brackfieldae]|uniref:1,6-anhydro-N-acetylmuramyl-L-alanine amidase AmpD n=1 Tax=Utexia brackfieldae TaxID=3074108 RepID=UPI00370D9F25
MISIDLNTAMVAYGYVSRISQIYSPFFNDRPNQIKPTLLVIHNISLPPQQYGGPYVEQLFIGCLDPKAHPYFSTIYQLQVSSHFFIRRSGEVIQFVSCDKRAWHAGKSSFKQQENCNDFSIGIELEGCDDEPFTDLQYQQLVGLTQLLYKHYPLTDIAGHSDIAPGRKTDPGPYFDWQRYFLLLKQARNDEQSTAAAT